MHRDIKPANILIGSNGQVKVADFGIARAMNAPTESNLTQAGAVMGTATYFSPEQAQGAQPDPRSDLYSLGIVMYEMVAGRAAVHRREPGRHRLQAGPRAPAAAQPDRRRRAPAVRGDRRQAAGQGPEGPLRDGQRAARRPAPVPQRRAGAGPRRRRRRGPRRHRAGDAATSTPAATVPMARDDRRASAPSPSRRRRSTGCRPAPRQAARYYEPPPSRTGWYALAAFFALDRPRHRRRAAVQRPVRRRRRRAATPSRTTSGCRSRTPSPTSTRSASSIEPVPEENTTVAEDIVHRTDPAGRRRSSSTTR